MTRIGNTGSTANAAENDGRPGSRAHVGVRSPEETPANPHFQRMVDAVRTGAIGLTVAIQEERRCLSRHPRELDRLVTASRRHGIEVSP